MKLSDLHDLPPVLRAEAVAELLDVSVWSLRESVKAGTAPVMPLRIGRRQVWPTAGILRVLEIGNGVTSGETPAEAGVSDPSLTGCVTRKAGSNGRE